MPLGLSKSFDEFDLALPQRGNAHTGGLEPAVAQSGVEHGAVAGGAQGATQALEHGHIGRQLMLLPQGLEGRLRKLFEHLEAVLLCINEFDNAQLLGLAAGTRGEERGAHGTFLPCRLLALDQVNQGHQLA